MSSLSAAGSTVKCPDCGSRSLVTDYEAWFCPYCKEVGEAVKKPNKFGAQKCQDDGYTFDSKAEWTRYQHLKLLAKAGKISRLEVHPVYQIEVRGVHICKYTADFAYYEQGSLIQVVEDVKSAPTRKKRDYVLVKKLMLAVHGITIREVMKGGK